MVKTHNDLHKELEHRVLHRTNRRIRNLAIEMDKEQVVLHGHTSTYYAKILAQEGVLELLPNVRIRNAIEVKVLA